jgi:hypothetical protein
MVTSVTSLDKIHLRVIPSISYTLSSIAYRSQECAEALAANVGIATRLGALGTVDEMSLTVHVSRANRFLACLTQPPSGGSDRLAPNRGDVAAQGDGERSLRAAVGGALGGELAAGLAGDAPFVAREADVCWWSRSSRSVIAS